MSQNQGKLFQTDDFCLRWVFLNPDTFLYLSGFGDRETAEDFGYYYGYDLAEPTKMSMAEINSRQPSAFSNLIPMQPVPQIPRQVSTAPAAGNPLPRPGLPRPSRVA